MIVIRMMILDMNVEYGYFFGKTSFVTNEYHFEGLKTMSP